MEYALNKKNLALIGALDDFHEIYNAVYDIYEPIMKEVVEESQAHNSVPASGKIDKMARKKVKEICDPLLDQYKMIFTDDPKRLYLKVTAFSLERCTPKGICKLEFSVGSFADFLVQIQWAVTNTLYGRRLATKPKYHFDPFKNEVNEHIKNYISDHNINLPDIDLIEEEHELTPDPLYVYNMLSSTLCHREQHFVVPDIYYGESLEDEKVVRLPVHYCEQCEKYYIGAVTYDMYEKIYGTIVAEKYRFNDHGIDFDEFCNESRLHRFGYNVIAGELSEMERRSLLVLLIKDGMMTYEEVSRTIERDIRHFSSIPRMGPAVSKWKSDQKYISDLVRSGNISKKQIRGNLNNGVE